MRSVTYLVAGLFLIYSVKTPRVLAGESPQIGEALEEPAAVLEDAGFPLLDEAFNSVSATALIEKSSRTFYVEGAVRIRVTIGDPNQGASVTLTALERDSGKVVARRNLKVASLQEKDAAALRLRLAQTVQSMTKEISKKRYKDQWLSVLLTGAGVLGIGIACEMFLASARLVPPPAQPFTLTRTVLMTLIGVAGVVAFIRGALPLMTREAYDNLIFL